MKRHWSKYLLTGVLIVLIVNCSSKPTDRGQQYIDNKIQNQFKLVKQPNIKGKPVNIKDFIAQIFKIRSSAYNLYSRHFITYNAIQNWLFSNADISQLYRFGLNAYQMAGTDNYGNVKFTSYYTPIIQARYTRQGEFQYPIYRMPYNKYGKKLPNRASIYNGILSDRYVLAYSNSLINNFIMDVQGSGYIDFGDGQPLRLFVYGGRNGWNYHSIGKELINRGEIKLEDMSIQAIRQQMKKYSLNEIRSLLETNPSFVFFKPEACTLVRGASLVPLIAQSSVASDSSLIPPGTVLLTEIPQLNEKGKFNGKYSIRLMVALDVGGAIKGHHLDIYQGIGSNAEHVAGFYNHYGRVWILQAN